MRFEFLMYGFAVVWKNIVNKGVSKMNDMPENEANMNEQGKNGVPGEVNAEAAANSAQVSDASAKETFNLGKEVFEWFYTIVIALAIAFLIKGFIFDVVRVDGPSMETTLMNNDRLIITKLGYKPHSGDIVILDSTYKNREAYYEVLKQNGENINAFTKLTKYFSLPKEYKKRYYVKRVIGLPGQTVDIVDGKVLVDGEEIDEPYLHDETTITDPTVSYPVTVADGCVFVMGDNRPHSKDSRSSELGQVPIKALLGKSQFRIWPLNSVGLTK